MTKNNVTLIVDVTVAHLNNAIVTDYRVNSENYSKHVGSVSESRNGECRAFS